MTISQGLLGANSADQIVIDNFNLATAETTKTGDLGLVFAEAVAVTADPSLAADPFRSGNYVPPNTTVAVSQGVAQSLTIDLSAPSTSAQQVTLTFTGGDLGAFALDTGSGALMPLAGGTVTLTIPAGSDRLTVGLIATQDLTTNQTLQVQAALVGSALSSAVTTGAVTMDWQAAGFTAPVPDSTVLAQPQTNPTETVYQGNAGIDSITTGTGNNIVYGGALGGIITGSSAGMDTILAYGNNVISGGGGQDIIETGNGNNRIYADSPTTLSSAIASAFSAPLTGGKGDFIEVGSGNNTIIGGTGDSFIAVGDGNDVIVCGSGDTAVLSGNIYQFQGGSTWTPIFNPTNAYDGIGGTYTFTDAGVSLNASAFGNPWAPPGNDTIIGGAGFDIFNLPSGNNFVQGGTGVINASAFGQPGNNTIFGGSGGGVITGGSGNDYLNGQSGNFWIDGGGGNNTIIGGSGNDTLYAGYDNTVLAYFGLPGTWASSATGNNDIQGGTGNDWIYGAGGHDTLIGGSGNDTIQAGNGTEYIVGGGGNDSLVGGSGNDTLIAGGAGSDTLVGGSKSTSSALIYGGSGNDTIYGGYGTDTIYAGSGADLIYAGKGNETIYGGSGSDTIYAGTGVEALYAGSGGTTSAPTLLVGDAGGYNLYGGAGVAVLNAQAGSGDLLVGGSGTDTLEGGSGNDTLIAGTGNNVLNGGSGNNTYVFGLGGGADQITQVSGSDTLVFGPGITAANLTVTAELGPNNQNNLVIQYDANGAVTVDGA